MVEDIYNFPIAKAIESLHKACIVDFGRKKSVMQFITLTLYVTIFVHDFFYFYSTWIVGKNCLVSVCEFTWTNSPAWLTLLWTYSSKNSTFDIFLKLIRSNWIPYLVVLLLLPDIIMLISYHIPPLIWVFSSVPFLLLTAKLTQIIVQLLNILVCPLGHCGFCWAFFIWCLNSIFLYTG